MFSLGSFAACAVAVVAVVVVCAGLPAFQDAEEKDENVMSFDEFMRVFGKVYTEEEERAVRLGVYNDNVGWIVSHNNKTERTWTAAVNQFADLTFSEFAQQNLLGDVQSCMDHVATPSPPPFAREAPESIDWFADGKVTPVKDQKRCQASYAFAAVASVESAIAIKTGVLTSLSEQQLVDCSSDYGTNGCKEGLPSQALEYVLAAGGIDTEDSYTYTASAKDCRFIPSASGGKISGVVNVTQNDEAALTNAVGVVGPATVSMNVPSGFQFYKTGIFSDPSCSTIVAAALHAVTAVGYGHDNDSGLDYWLMKNSWGQSWGKENGFFRIQRNTNECVLALCASYPVS